MRRKDREVLGDENIAKIIEQCTTCHVAMIDDANVGMPYVIPMSFGYSLMDGVLELYFHCAHVGKKLDCILKNPNVAFSMCVENRIEIHEDDYCRSGRFYASVVGQGKAVGEFGSVEEVDFFHIMEGNGLVLGLGMGGIFGGFLGSIFGNVGNESIYWLTFNAVDFFE